MSTYNIDNIGISWINIVQELSLSVGSSYFIQNVTPYSLEMCENSSLPISDVSGQVLLPNTFIERTVGADDIYIRNQNSDPNKFGRISIIPIGLSTELQNVIVKNTVQYPVAADSDSVYVKDIDIENSDNGDFSGFIEDYFNSLKSVNSNATSNNPKIIKIWFQRTVYAHEIALGCDNLVGDFGTNVTVKLLGSGDIIRLTKNFSGIDPNSAGLAFGPAIFNGFILEFNTTSEVCLSNITIRKAIEASSTLKALKPDGTVTNIDATNGGNLKVSLEEVENQISTNSNSQIKTTLYGEDGQALYIEKVTSGVPNINTDHALIHMGYGYSFSAIINTLGNAAIKSYCLTSPLSRYIHLKNVNIQSLGSSIKVEILINSDITVNTGSIIPIVNLNHNSSMTATAEIREDPTYTGGTAVRTVHALADSTNQTTGIANFNQNSNQEFITKNNNEQYILKVTNLSSDSCIVSIDAFMYEESLGLTS